VSGAAAAAIYGAALRGEWPLDPAVTYLNHGGYGVAPHEVLAVQAAWRDRIERNPTRFMVRELPDALRAAASAVARYIGAAPEDVVFVDNATGGCNAVLRSIDLAPGDEILVTNLGYGAITKAARYAAERSGAQVIESTVPLPLPDEEAVIAAVAARLGPRTRLAVFDHVASHTALVLPVAALSRLAHEAGARVLIDGAHAPGQVALDVPGIGADWYIGNCHKWLMAPRGCGFLWAAPAIQQATRPLAISHGYGGGFQAEFGWTGTRDPSPFLAAPAGIAFHDRLGGDGLRARNEALARAAGRLLLDAWGTAIGGPEACFAAMVTVRLPLAGPGTDERAWELYRRLSDEHGIEVAVMAFADALWVRIAAQAYNERADYERLAAVFRA
jgi:isopenicillin-N epimerase